MSILADQPARAISHDQLEHFTRHMSWLWPVVGGLAAAPVGAAGLVILLYIGLALTGTTEHEGRRGLLALAVGIPLGLIGGFLSGAGAVAWLAERYAESNAAGIATGCFLSIALGVTGFYYGVMWAEDRGVPMGSRAIWGLTRVAIPLAAAGAIGGYLLGRHLSGR